MLTAASFCGPTMAAENRASGFEPTEVEDLALYIAVESMRRLRIPLVLRIISIGHDTPTREEEIDKIRANPPKADARGIVHPFGENNGMSFLIDPATGELLVNERMMKTRGKMPNWGLTAPEHATALNEASSEGERGGGTFIYEPLTDTLVLQKRFAHPMIDRKRFYREVDDMKKTGLKWFDGRYVDRSDKILSARVPPRSATVQKQGFQATLLLRHFGTSPEASPWAVNRFIRAWDRDDKKIAPRLITDLNMQNGQKMYAFIIFKGAEQNSDGVAQVGATFRLIGPDERVLLANLNPLLWNAPAKPTDFLQIGMNNISFRIQDEPPGTYQVEANVCDLASERCVSLVHPFELL